MIHSTMNFKIIYFLFIIQDIHSTALFRTKSAKILDGQIGVYKDDSSRILHGKIVKVYDSLSVAKKAFRSLRINGNRINGQRFFAHILPIAR